MPEDGQITVRAWAELERVVIVISDTGPGIPTDKHPLMFRRRFYTGTEPVPPLTSGAGLGLLIVQACVEQSTFTVAFESEQGKGTTFHINIPQRHLV
jgi:signal transduction histidine kinase